MIAVHAMHGFGDTLYQRPIVRALAETDEVFVTTPWPQLFADLPVKLVRPTGTWRTQQRNLDRVGPGVDWTSDRGVRQVHFGYLPGGFRGTSLFEVFVRKVGLEDREAFDWSLPLPPCSVVPEKPYAVVRPVTERVEWLNRARNPRAEYVAEAAQDLRRRGYTIVSVADLADGEEWAVEPMPEADLRFHAGELGATNLLSLVSGADVVVGPVGWIVPACVTLGTPLVVVGGGQGGHNAPERLVDRRMPLSPVCWIRPEPACDCASMKHDCNKAIPRFAEQFAAAMDLLAVRA